MNRAEAARALGYLRVSTQEQATRGAGLEAQERAIRAWCAAHGARLLRIERDESSGTNGLDTRAGLRRALLALTKDEADVLVVARLDRLARDLVLQETILQRVERQGKRVVSVQEGETAGDDPTRRFIRQVLGAVAELERAIMRARADAGKAAKRAQGLRTDGIPPYGYRLVAGRLVPIPEQQAVIERMQALRAEGKSLRQIARVLEDAGIPSPTGRERWYAQTLKGILDRS